MRRRNLFMRDLVDRVRTELESGRASIKVAAHRLYYSGVPMEVALRVIAGR